MRSAAAWPRLVPRAVCVALLLAGPAAGTECLDTYPAQRVNEALADARYANCKAVAQDYVEFLTEQGRLLAELQPALRRKLLSDYGPNGETRVQQRLAQFDASRQILVEAASQLRNPPSAAAPAGSAASAPQGRAAIRQALKDSRDTSQLLSDRIGVGVSQFDSSEMATYCREDLVFRLASGLHARLAACLSGD